MAKLSQGMRFRGFDKNCKKGRDEKDIVSGVNVSRGGAKYICGSFGFAQISRI